MRWAVYWRTEHAGPHVTARWSGSVVSVIRGLRELPNPCDCCSPYARGRRSDGRIVKADPGGYWVACRHGRSACPECGAGADHWVAGAEYIPVGRV